MNYLASSMGIMNFFIAGDLLSAICTSLKEPKPLKKKKDLHSRTQSH